MREKIIFRIKTYIVHFLAHVIHAIFPFVKLVLHEREEKFNINENSLFQKYLNHELRSFLKFIEEIKQDDLNKLNFNYDNYTELKDKIDILDYYYGKISDEISSYKKSFHLLLEKYEDYMSARKDEACTKRAVENALSDIKFKIMNN